MRSSGSVMGGAINFSTNNEQASAGGIAWSTYLIFVGFGKSTNRQKFRQIMLIDDRVHRCYLGALALADEAGQASRRRESADVTDDLLEPGARRSLEASSAQRGPTRATGGLRNIADGFQTLLIALPSFYSFFYGGTMGTYLSLHFSVRARALSSLLVRTSQQHLVPTSFPSDSNSLHHNPISSNLRQAARQPVPPSKTPRLARLRRLDPTANRLPHLGGGRIPPARR